MDVSAHLLIESHARKHARRGASSGMQCGRTTSKKVHSVHTIRTNKKKPVECRLQSPLVVTKAYL